MRVVVQCGWEGNQTADLILLSSLDTSLFTVFLLSRTTSTIEMSRQVRLSIPGRVYRQELDDMQRKQQCKGTIFQIPPPIHRYARHARQRNNKETTENLLLLLLLKTSNAPQLSKSHSTHLPNRRLIKQMPLNILILGSPTLPNTPIPIRSSSTNPQRTPLRSHKPSLTVRTGEIAIGIIERQKTVPDIGSLQHILHHGYSEAVAVVFWRGDGRFVFAAVFDPGFKFFVPGVGADAVWRMDMLVVFVLVWVW